jgi:hypothetical protein
VLKREVWKGRVWREAVGSDLEPLFYLFLPPPPSSFRLFWEIEKAVTTEVDNCGEGGSEENEVIREGKFY